MNGHKQRKPLSKARRLARVLVWTAFGLVLYVRFFVFEPPPPRQRPGPAFTTMGQQERRFRRPRTFTPPPVSEVPRDLPRFQIEIAAPDVEILRQYYWRRPGGGMAGDRPSVRARVVEGATVYTNVALHLKGSAGSFRPFDDKPALTLNFSKHAPGQRFRGFSKISLNNSVQDPTYVCEIVSRELFLKAGVPVPTADHATVVINGRDLGLYVMVEGYNKDFLANHFSNTKGNLYEGGFCQDITYGLEVDSGENPDDQSDIDRLVRAASEPDSLKRWPRLGEILDIDRFLKMVAMETLTCHWDGYSQNRNNYRVFHDRSISRLVFMPHGLDQMFGTHRSSPRSSIRPPMHGIITYAVLSTEPGYRQYIDTLDRLYSDLFDATTLTNRVRQLARRLQPTLAAYHPNIATYHEHEINDLCQRILERAESVAEQLAAPRDAMAFDSNGVAVLTNWIARVQSASSQPAELNRVLNQGRSLLHAALGSQTAVCSWRSRGMLNPGRYRFQARAKTRDPEAKIEVALRIAGVRIQPVKLAPDEWTPLVFPFEIGEPMTEVEFICDIRGQNGEVWLEEDSLRLARAVSSLR